MSEGEPNRKIPATLEKPKLEEPPVDLTKTQPLVRGEMPFDNIQTEESQLPTGALELPVEEEPEKRVTKPLGSPQSPEAK